MSLNEFEKLLDWFEKSNDPWFYEKHLSKLRELKSMQSKYCPCNKSNYTNQNIDIKNIVLLFFQFRCRYKYKYLYLKVLQI